MDQSDSRSIDRQLRFTLLLSAWLGGVLWLILAAIRARSLFADRWAEMILLLAALVIVPLGLRHVLRTRTRRETRYARTIMMLQAPAAVVLVVATFLPQGELAAALTLPWLVCLLLIGLAGLRQLRNEGARRLAPFSITAGMLFIIIGGVWAFLSRAGHRPLEFEPQIVLLTAIHFHYAGFALPVIAGMTMRRRPTAMNRMGIVLVILGVPLVAAGITATQIGAGPLLECVAAWVTAGGAVLVAGSMIRLAIHRRQWDALRRTALIVAGACLAMSMALAAAYGSRAYVDVAALDIPIMRATHGTGNAIGFALLALIALPRRLTE